jgi:hypothetical protein
VEHLQKSTWNYVARNKYFSLYNLAFSQRYKEARYQDPKTSRWMSTDPALGEYIPGAPVNDEVKKQNWNSPGMGGVFNTVNMHLYHYAGNNPVKYNDPTGLVIELSSDATQAEIKQYDRAIAYLKTSEEGQELIKKLEKSPEIFTIMFVDDDNMYYDPEKKEIFFDVDSGLITGDGNSVQSAALGLAHEMGHGAQHLDGGMNKFLNKPTSENRGKLEEANLHTYENPIAKRLGEPTRENYGDVSGVKRMNNSTHFRTTTGNHNAK